MCVRMLWAGVAMLSLLAPAAAAQQPTGRAAEEPAAVARAAFTAVAAHNWNEAASLIDSAAVVRFRHEILQQAWSSADHRQWEPRAAPDLPACVAEYVKQHELAPRMPATLAKEQLLGLASTDELERLTPMALVGRYLGWNDESTRARRQNPGGTVPRTARTVLGAVTVGDSIAYVVYSQATYFGLTSSGLDQVTLLQLVRRGPAWRIATPEALAGFNRGGVLIGQSIGMSVLGPLMTGTLISPAGGASGDTVARPRPARPDEHH